MTGTGNLNRHTAAVEHVDLVVVAGIMCERCGTKSAVEATVRQDTMDVATLVGCRRCRTGICVNTEER